jgi:uncharacterized protein with HEPN domain
VKDDRVYLNHILSATQRVSQYTAAGRGTFLAEPMRQDAVVRNLEIIGEAVKHLSDELKAKHPGLEWRRVAGMRDKMIHEYFGVNMQLVWEAAEKDLPQLESILRSILRGLEMRG